MSLEWSSSSANAMMTIMEKTAASYLVQQIVVSMVCAKKDNANVSRAGKG